MCKQTNFRVLHAIPVRFWGQFISGKILRPIQNPVNFLRWRFLRKSKPLIFFQKSSILDVWHGSEYASQITD